jgi:two-component system response regulator FixJ
MRKSLVFLLAAAGYVPRAYDGGDAFVAAAPALPPGCVLTDVRMPGMDGEAVAGALGHRLGDLPLIVMTGHGDVAMAVRMMRCGASDFLEKPFDGSALLASLAKAFAGLDAREQAASRRAAARQRLAALTAREAEVLARLAEGHANKMIAWQLSLSVRTIEMYRSQMMERLGVRSLPEALQLRHDADPPVHAC